MRGPGHGHDRVSRGEEARTVRFGVSLPQGLLRELDERIVSRGYSSRSEFIRDLIREQLVAQKWEEAAEHVFGVLTIVYDHHQRELLGRLLEAQHVEHLRTVCATHVHMDHSNCLEVIILQGSPTEVEKLSLMIGGLRGVRFAKLTRVARIQR